MSQILSKSLYLRWNYTLLKKCIEYIGCTDLLVEKYKEGVKDGLLPSDYSPLKFIIDEAVTSGNLICFGNIIQSEAFAKYMEDITGISVDYWRGNKCLNLGIGCKYQLTGCKSDNLTLPITITAEFNVFLTDPLIINFENDPFSIILDTLSEEKKDEFKNIYSLDVLLAIIIFNQKNELKGSGVCFQDDPLTTQIGTWKKFTRKSKTTNKYVPRYINIYKNSELKTMIQNLLSHYMQEEDTPIKLNL